MNTLEAIQDQYDRCAKSLPMKYVSWLWMAGIIVALVAATTGATWVVARGSASVDAKLEFNMERTKDNTLRIERLEDVMSELQGLRRDIRSLRSELKEN